MRYRAMTLCCECGRAPARIDDVGFTPNRELVVHWWCSGCKKAIYVVKGLADCWRDCPSKEDLPPEQPPFEEQSDGAHDYEAEDLKFLRSMKVKLPDDGE